MAFNEDVQIDNGELNYTFLFRAVAPFRDKKEQPTLAIPLINNTAANNLLFRFSGQQEEITFTFAIWDDGEDASNGTHTSGTGTWTGGVVTTVAEQIEFLRDQVFSEEFDTPYTLTQSRYHSGGIGGVLERVEFDNPSGSGTLITGTVVFKVGIILDV